MFHDADKFVSSTTTPPSCATGFASGIAPQSPRHWQSQWHTETPFCQRILVLAVLFSVTSFGQIISAEPAKVEHPLSSDERAEIATKFNRIIEENTRRIETDGKNEDLYSRRGDAYFFRGKFAEAVADYDKMIELQPDTAPSHWRRGIALFYAGKYEAAAKQFEDYHSFDDIDRENGIWRYFSQRKAFGLEKARQGLLKYKKDDREPFPDVYKLFAGEITPDEILRHVATAKIDEAELEKRLFYAELYIGLNEAVEGRNDSARAHLRRAVMNNWGRRAGYGPNFMWHVGRVQFELLNAPMIPGKDD